MRNLNKPPEVTFPLADAEVVDALTINGGNISATPINLDTATSTTQGQVWRDGSDRIILRGASGNRTQLNSEDNLSNLSNPTTAVTNLSARLGEIVTGFAGASNGQAVRKKTDGTGLEYATISGTAIGDLTTTTDVNLFDDFFAIRDTSAGGDRKFDLRNHPLLRPDRYFITTLSFYAGLTLANNAIFGNLSVSAAGTNANLNNTGSAPPPGWIRCTAGTTTSGRAALSTNSNAAASRIIFATGKRWYIRAQVYLSALSDATDTYVAKIGFDGSFVGTSDNNSLYFRYTHSENSGNWQAVARASATETMVDTATAPATTEAGSQTLEILYTPGTNAIFYINGTTVATITTNLPIGTSQRGQVTIGIAKSAGTTARDVLLKDIVVIGEF